MAAERIHETDDTGVAVSHPILPSPEPVEERPRDFSLKCMKDKQIPIAVTIVITALIITIIALAAKKPPHCPSCPPHIIDGCPNDWVGFQGKCYYFSETDGNWSSSRIQCSSRNASLALIDSLKELDFMIRYKGSPYCWVGLHREEDQPWKWINGTVFNNLFQVSGEGQCAFLSDNGVSSSRCYSERLFICNQPDECSRKKLSTKGGQTISKIT